MQKLIPIAEKICLEVFDDTEPDDWHAPISFSLGNQEWVMSLAQLSAMPLVAIKEKLGEDIFHYIIEKQGYLHPKTEFQTYEGLSQLALYYFTFRSKDKDNQILIVSSCGEFQPMRWKAYIEGIWEIRT
ncbi:MAG: hypothetical protein MUE81_12280 [Thermoflexibacter sp.]|nr:hypothetical protein [Thermoflexibacter sp.]